MFWRLTFFLVLLAVFHMSGMAQERSKTEGLKISSSAFGNEGQIPRKYGCAGENVNPSLRIDHVPLGTKSLALIFDDKDAPDGSYVHWILWNIPPRTKVIKENSVPEEAIQGRNDFKKNRYGGPCPPTRPHRYLFKLYALDVRLDLDADSSKAALEKAMQGHILGQAQLTGRYKRK